METFSDFEIFKTQPPASYNNIAQRLIIADAIEHYKTNAPNIDNIKYSYIQEILKNNLYYVIRNAGYNIQVKDLGSNEVYYSTTEFKSGKQIISINSYVYSCELCGGNIIFNLSSSEITVTHSSTECVKRENYTLKLTVPSSGLMVANDYLGSIVQEPEDRLSVNYLKGRIELSKYYENNGFISFYVGNTSPDIFRCYDGSLIVASAWAVCTEESDYEEICTKKFPNIKEKICGITTDLHWCTISSVQHCKELEKTGKKYRKGETFNLEEGEWECEVQVENGEAEDSSNGIYCIIKKVK